MNLRCVSTARYFQMRFHCESINDNEKAAQQMLFVVTLEQNLGREPYPARREYFGKYLLK